MDAASAVTAKLHGGNWWNRRNALNELAKLGPDAVSAHVGDVLMRLEETDWEVREAAIQTLGVLEPSVLSNHAEFVLRCLGDEDLAVRRAAAGVLRRLPKVVAVNVSAVAPLLRDGDASVRKVAVEALGTLRTRDLAVHSCAVLERLDDVDKGVRSAALSVLHDFARDSASTPPVHRLESEHHLDRCAAIAELSVTPSDLDAHCMSVAARLGDKISQVRGTAAGALAQLDPKVLAPFAQQLVELLGDDDMPTRMAAVGALGKLDPPSLPATVCRGETLLHHAARLGHIQVVSTLSMRHRTVFLNAKNGSGDTALHVAAQAGHLEACQLLVRAGALTKARNDSQRTTLDLAMAGGHTTIVNFLQSRDNLGTVRGGAGDALAQAMADPRPIIAVEWYRIPLPGVAGLVGGMHSLLTITVGTDAAAAHSYVLEKAATTRGAIEKAKDQEQFRMGVHVSHWLDVVPNVEGAPMHALQGSDIENHTGDTSFCMRTLRNLAVTLGPYNVANCNCHHASLAVYNACARESARVPRIPNELLTWGARLLSSVGIDVAESGSGSGGGSQSFGSQPSHSAGSQSAGSESKSVGIGSMRESESVGSKSTG